MKQRDVEDQKPNMNGKVRIKKGMEMLRNKKRMGEGIYLMKLGTLV